MNFIKLTKLYDCNDIMQECTKQAQEVLQTIIDNNKEDEFINYLIDMNYEDVDDVADLLHHDWQEVYKALEIEED